MKTGQSSSTAQRAPTPRSRGDHLLRRFPASRRIVLSKQRPGGEREGCPTRCLIRSEVRQGRGAAARSVAGDGIHTVCRWRGTQAAAGVDLQLAVAQPQRERISARRLISFQDRGVWWWADDHLFSYGNLHSTNSNI